jgi:hypothetical protein
MKKFLAIYIGTPTSPSAMKWEALDEAGRKKQEEAGMKAWGTWGEANGRAIKDMGAPLGKTKRIGANGISDIKNQMTAYTIIEAESHDAAAKIFLNHPHFMIFPGDSVEVMECLPMPGAPKA